MTIPDVPEGDPRVNSKMRILRRPSGRRYIELDGVEFPAFTQGEITVSTLRGGAYMPSGGFWPATPDEEYVKGAGPVLRHYVNLTLSLDGVEVEDPELLTAWPDEEETEDA